MSITMIIRGVVMIVITTIIMISMIAIVRIIVSNTTARVNRVSNIRIMFSIGSMIICMSVRIHIRMIII